MGKKKGAFSSSNSVTLRLFQGAQEGSVFEVVKVTGQPKNIDIDALVEHPDTEQPEMEQDSRTLETFDGYFPEDGYDYSQHLREINPDRFVPAITKPAMKKPEKVTNSDLAEVMAALEGASEETIELNEDFFQKLGPLDDRTRLGLMWGEDQVDEYLDMPTDKLMAIQDRIQSREKESMMKQQTQEDKEFEALFAREFSDEQIGALNPDDIEIIEEEEYDWEQEDDDEDDDELNAKEEDFEDIRAEGLDETKKFILTNQNLQQSVIDAEDDGFDVVLVPAAKKPDWDCESVLSTRSNIYNHPGMIFRPPKEKKKPAPVIEAVPEENQQDVQDNNEIDTPVISTFRPKNETPEERKARKQAIKQFQRDQREAKSSEKKAQKEALNKAKMVNAINKRQNYGDIPSGVSRFAI
jgi:protein LTV1